MGLSTESRADALPSGPRRFSLAPGAGRHPHRSAILPAGERAARLPVTSLREALRRRAERTPDQVAFYYLDLHDRIEEMRCGDLCAAATGVAAGLGERKVAAGDRLVLCFESAGEAITAFFACALIGAIPALIGPPRGRALGEPWKRAVVERCRAIGAAGLVVSGPWRERIRDAAAPAQVAFVACLSELTETGRGRAPLGAGELAYLQFSSGTTGPPRAVRVTHGALLANVGAIGELSQWRDDDLVVSWLPLHHDMGLVGLTLAPFLHGLPVALLPPLAFMLRPSRWLWALHHFRATVSGAPNFAYHLCASKVHDRDLEGLDLGSWRMAYNGAELVNPATVRRFTERFGPCGFRADAMYPVYGMAEMVVAATFPRVVGPPRIDTIDRDSLSGAGRAAPVPPESTRAASFVGVGEALPGHEMRIVDARGNDLPERRQGQVLLRGPSLAAGYFDDERRSRRTFRDGWLWTGDLGYLAGGELFVCGRAKDLIIRVGHNYHPQAFEAAAAEVEGVRPGGVAAFGIPDDEIGTEKVVLVFETAVTGQDERSRICRRIHDAVTRSAGVGPDRLVAVPPRTLPRTSSGKLARAAARRRYLDGAFD